MADDSLLPAKRKIHLQPTPVRAEHGGAMVVSTVVLFLALSLYYQADAILLIVVFAVSCLLLLGTYGSQLRSYLSGASAWNGQLQRVVHALERKDADRMDRELAILQKRSEHFAPSDPRRARVLINLAAARQLRHDHVECTRLLREALAILRQNKSDEAIVQGCYLVNALAAYYLNAKKWAEAQEILDIGMSWVHACEGLFFFELSFRESLAGLNLDLGQWDKAEEHLTRADMVLPFIHELHELTWKQTQNLLFHYWARWHLARGNKAEAWRMCEQISSEAAEHYHLTRGECLLAFHEFPGAETHLRAAFDAAILDYDLDGAVAIEFKGPLVGALIGQRKFDDATALQAKVEALFDKHGIAKNFYWHNMLAQWSGLWRLMGRTDQAEMLEEKRRAAGATLGPDTAIQIGRNDALVRLPQS